MSQKIKCPKCEIEFNMEEGLSSHLKTIENNTRDKIQKEQDDKIKENLEKVKIEFARLLTTTYERINQKKMAHLGLTGDYPMPSRSDCMSLQTITAKRDQVSTNTSKFASIRNTSSNLNTNDIQGKSTQIISKCKTKTITDIVIE